MTVGFVMRQAAAELRSLGIDTAVLDVEIMMGAALGLDRIQLLLAADEPLANGDNERFRVLLARRRDCEPVAYITGLRWFYKHVFEVTAEVLIPRPETEHLIERSLSIFRASNRPPPRRVADIGTGSGAIAISLALEWPTAEVVATDISEAAVGVAKRNAVKLGADVSFLVGDLLAPLEALKPTPTLGHGFDLIVSNPPYIPDGTELMRDVGEYEPKVALFGGVDGLDSHRVLIEGARRYLCKDAYLGLEFDPDQAETVQHLFVDAGYTEVSVGQDYSQRVRYGFAKWPG